jgi:FkbM family methyltransferase
MNAINKQEKEKPFHFKRDSVGYRIGRFKNSIYRKITKNHLPLFFRGGDTITTQPMVNGVYEPEIKSLIEYYADAGYSDFFIDIGANIGLTSCQSGRRFKELHLYEPNPDCCNILKVNTNIMLTGHNYKIHEYGLGEKSSNLKFCTPHNNWGGAFVMSEGNSYSEKIQAAKDGHKKFDASQYAISEVKIEPAEKIMRNIFNSLSERNLNSGVIKIDVEGYELTILDAISKTLPERLKIAIIFENWSSEINFSTVLHNFDKRARMMKIVTIKKPIKILPRWINTILLLMRGSIDTVLAPCASGSHTGDLVLEVASKNNGAGT